MLKFLRQDLHQSWFIIVYCIGIILGTIIGLVFRISFFTSIFWRLFSILTLIFTLLISKTFLIILIIITGGILSLHRISSELHGENYIKQFHEQNVVITGTIDGDPETDETGTKIKLKNLQFGDERIKASGSIYVSLRQNYQITRADTITVSGKLSTGFGTFAGYMYKPMIKNISRPEPGDLILRIRNWFAERIKKLIPEPEVNLGLSYLLGMKSNLPNDLSENLRLVGLVHIVVASGAHLSILVNIARKIFGKLSRFSGLLFSIIFILFFMTMVGFTPSILRAGIMSILSLLAWYVGRKFTPWRIIIIVAAFTLILNPMFIINLGWLLSFASYAGIMVLNPKLTKFFYDKEEPGFIASIIITTISATLMTLPIIIYYYGMISLISIVANLLILPTLPYAMGLVFLTGVATGIPGVETFIAFITTKLLDFHILVVNFFSAQKSFLIAIEPYQPQVFLIYIIIITPLIFNFIKKHKHYDKINL